MKDSFDIDNTSVCIYAVNKEVVPMYDKFSGIAFTALSATKRKLAQRVRRAGEEVINIQSCCEIIFSDEGNQPVAFR